MTPEPGLYECALIILGDLTPILAVSDVLAGKGPEGLGHDPEGYPACLVFDNTVPPPGDLDEDARLIWMRAAWGCDSGALETVLVDEGTADAVRIYFETHGNPPLRWVAATSAAWPDITLRLFYTSDRYAGIVEYRAGAQSSEPVHLVRDPRLWTWPVDVPQLFAGRGIGSVEEFLHID